jgi:4-carboxymuconolactone decarboxylase
LSPKRIQLEAGRIAGQQNEAKRTMERRRQMRHPISHAAVPLLAAALSIGSVHAQDAPKRFPQITLEQMNAQQREVAEQILKISSIGLTGPYNPLLRSPVLAARWRSMFDYLRFNSSVPRRLNEFAILIQARRLTSQVEWYAHAPMAIEAGLAEDIIEDLKQGRRPAKMRLDEAAVYDVLTEFWDTQAVSDATFRRAREIFTEQQIVDLTVISGGYVMVAMLLAVANEGVPSGTAPPLRPLQSK